MDMGAAIVALGALAQEHRLALFRLLVQAGDKGMSAGAIAEKLGVPNSSLSFHLAARRRRPRAARSSKAAGAAGLSPRQ